MRPKSPLRRPPSQCLKYIPPLHSPLCTTSHKGQAERVRGLGGPEGCIKPLPQVQALRSVEPYLGLEKLYVLGTNCVDNGPRAGLEKFLGAASEDPGSVLHYEFMQASISLASGPS